MFFSFIIFLKHLAGTMNSNGGGGGVGHFGLSLPNMSSTRPANRPDMGTSKMLPFMNNHGASNGGGNSGASGFGPRLYHEAPSMSSGMGGMSGLGVGSMGGMPSNNMGYMAGQNGSLNHMSANKPQGSWLLTLEKGCFGIHANKCLRLFLFFAPSINRLQHGQH